MPCYDGGPSTPQPRLYHGLTAEQLEATLCAVFTTLTEIDFGGSEMNVAEVLNNTDWKEAGVNRAEVAKWWKLHQAADKARKQREADAKAAAERQAMLKASALAKLTPAERIALGLS